MIIQDPTLLHQVDVFSGVAPGACVLINTSGTVATLGIEDYAQQFSAGHQLTRGRKDEPSRPVKLKTKAGSRDVVLLPDLARLLQQHLRNLRRNDLANLTHENRHQQLHLLEAIEGHLDEAQAPTPAGKSC